MTVPTYVREGGGGIKWTAIRQKRAAGPCPPASTLQHLVIRRLLDMLRIKGSQDRVRGHASETEKVERVGKRVDACARRVCGGQPVAWVAED